MADKRISQLTDRGTVANNDVVAIVVSGAVTTNKATISSIQTFMQGNLDLGVTSVGITLGSSGTDVSVTGSPITTSGNITINIPTASAANRGVLSAADFTTFNAKQGAITLTTTGTSGAATLVSNTLNIPNYAQDLSGFVTLGTAQTITAQKTFSTSGGSDTMIISHSGSGFALDAIKAGNGPVIRVNKTSGSGNAMTVQGGNFEAPTIVKTGGTSSQFLKADGSIDSSVYYLASNPAGYTTNVGTVTSVAATAGTGITISGSPITTSGTLTITNSAPDQVVALTASTGISISGTYPNFTITNTSPSSGGTVTSVGLSSATSGVTIGSSPVTTSGTITLAIATASGSQNGLLSSTDWTTFNNKANSVAGGYLPLSGGTLTGALGGTQLSINTTNATGKVNIQGPNDSGLLYLFNSSANARFMFNNYFGFGIDSMIIQEFNTSNVLVRDIMSFAVGGNVGIGNTLPTFKLDVSGTGRFTGALTGTSATFSSSVSIGGADQGYQLDVKRTSTGDSTFDTVANFYKASTHNTGLLLRLKNTIVDLAANNITGGGGPTAGMSFSVSSGGTISTALTLSSTGAATFSNTLRVNTPNRSFFMTSNAYSISDGTLSSGFGMDGDGLYLGNVASSTGWTIANPQVTILANGNFLIGTTTPNGARLQVNGTNPAFDIQNAGSTYFRAELDGSNITYLSTFGANDMILRTNATARLTLNGSTGAATFSSSVGIGGNPTNRLTALASQTGTQITTIPVAKFANTGNEFSKVVIGSDNANFDGVISMDNNATLANTKLRFYIGNGTNSTAGHSNDQIVLTGNGNVGIGTATPNSNLQVSGSVSFPHTTKSANYTLDATDYTVGFDCASSRTANLPDATTCAGRVYVIYQTNTNSGARFVTLDGNGSQTINGLTTYSLQYYENFSSVMIQSNGSNWIIISDALYPSPV